MPNAPTKTESRQESLRLLNEKCPPLVEELCDWFNTLDNQQLDRAWVQSVVSLVMEYNPEMDVAQLVRALNTVRMRLRGKRMIERTKQHPSAGKGKRRSQG
jgi:hypothetical protein